MKYLIDQSNMYDVFLISQPSPQHREEQKQKKSLREHPRSWQSSKLLYTMDCTILYMPHKINHSLYHALGNKTRISPTTTSWLVLLAKTFSCLHKPFIHIFYVFLLQLLQLHLYNQFHHLVAECLLICHCK